MTSAPKRRWFRFGLLTLVLMALSAGALLGLGIYAYRKLLHEREAEVAEIQFYAIWVDYQHQNPMAGDAVYQCSCRWKDAQIAASFFPNQRQAALEEHLKRMQRMLDAARDLQGSHLRIYWLDSAEVYVAEANRWASSPSALARQWDPKPDSLPELCQRTYLAVDQDVQRGLETSETYCNWSRRWLDEQLLVLKTASERNAAKDAHLKRMQSFALDTKDREKAMIVDKSDVAIAEKFEREAQKLADETKE
jgi:hypothetical protein